MIVFVNSLVLVVRDLKGGVGTGDMVEMHLLGSFMCPESNLKVLCSWDMLNPQNMAFLMPLLPPAFYRYGLPVSLNHGRAGIYPDLKEI